MARLFFLVALVFSFEAYNQTIDWELVKERNEACLALVNKDLEKAEVLNDSLLSIIKEPYDSSILSGLYTVKANIFFKKGEFEQSLRYNLKALAIRENTKDSLQISRSLGNIGNIYYYTDDLQKAIDYHLQAIEILRLTREEPYTASLNYNTIALVYFEKLEFDSSKKYFELGIESCNNAPKEYLQTKAMLYSNLASLYQERGNSNLAIEYLNAAKSIHLELNRISSLTWTYYNIGDIYLANGNVDSALATFKKADSYAEVSSTLDLKKDIKYNIFKCYLLMNQVDSALKYNDIFYSLNDSIVQMKTNSNIQDMEAKYQLDKKEAALELLKEKEARATAENKTNKLYLLIAVIGIFILGGIFFFINRSNQQKRKIGEMKLEIKENEMKELMALQEAEALSSMLKGQEEERERIAKDLHDQLGGTLAALKLSLRRKENKVTAEDLETVDQAVTEIRNIAHNLSNGLLEKQGLTAALRELKQSIERSGKLKFNLFLQAGFSNIGQETALELYRIVQELTNNTIKHAKATEISLQTNEHESNFNLIYEDNGVGFNKEEVKEGMGTRNIQARLKKINGTLHLDSQKGRGTIAIIEIEKS